MNESSVCKETRSSTYQGLPCASVSSMNIGYIAAILKILHVITTAVCLGSPTLSGWHLFKLCCPTGYLF